jgi:AcrR family transcriptional regulator
MARNEAETEAPKRDGRHERSRRTNRAIVTALLDLVAEGNFEPTAGQIAERAGVALRSIRQHFSSREELFLAAVEAYTQRVAPTREEVDVRMPLAERIAAFAEVRGRELELSSPIRRATGLLDSAEQQVRASSAIGRAIDVAWQRRRREVAHVFAAELARGDDKKGLLDAVDLLAHGRTWDTMRFVLGLSRGDATATLRRTLGALLRA